MVCASTEKSDRIAGGFILVSVPALMRVWRTCRARPLGIGDFRAWLACHELVARRCHVHRDRDRSPRFGVAELAKLLDVTERRARASVRRLVVAGLLEWSDESIGFPDPRTEPAEGLDDTIGRGRGDLAIPRRMLRFLVAGARPALIATVLGLLLRCLSRRKDGFDGRGRVKASWIARVFAVDLRRVKAARRELVALGWIEPESSNQSAENRWGRAYRIDLAWDRVEAGGRRLPPLPAVGRPAIATPSINQEPLREGIQNQEPARGATGFSIEEQGGEAGGSTTRGDRAPVMLTDAQASPGLCSGPAEPLPAPKLADVRLDDLKSTTRLLDLHRQAVARGLVTASEADRLRFIGAAEHALAIATNPAALFAWLVLNGCWRYITGADEDSARRRLRAHDFGPAKVSAQPSPLAFSSSRPVESGGLSEDARIVKAIREATIRAGVFRDPWPAFAARYPEWDRERWDAALGELGLG
jgi:hypothetical protein